MSSQVRMGMIGGGNGAFIGAVHRMAAALDSEIELVCGALSRDFANCVDTGRQIELGDDRCYPDIEAMDSCERSLADGASTAAKAMQFLSIVTPNQTHVCYAASAAKAGFHVLSEKPAGISLAEVEDLARVLEETGMSYGLTHTYLGYPMVWQARHLAQSPQFGAIRKVHVRYVQGWLAQSAEESGSKQAQWRVDPVMAGPAGALGDIGSHAHSLTEFISNSRMTAVSAKLRSHVAGRALDDDGEVLFTLENGATGSLVSSQVCTGEENGLSITIYGEDAGLEWRQMEPNSLIERRSNGTCVIHRAGIGKPLCEEALSRCRLPSGHPEGYIEAFANLYRNFARALRGSATPVSIGVPGIAEALRGMAFLESAVASSNADGAEREIKAPSVGPDLKGLLT